MSAKGRGGESVAFDNYPTPTPYVEAIFDALTVDGVPDAVLDPCCGSGSILSVADGRGVLKIYGIELQADLAGVAKARGFASITNADALAPRCVWPKVPLILSNPPYTYAEEFLRKSIDSGADTVSFLLRLGFLSSKTRAPFFEQYGMPSVRVVDRPSFCMTVKCKDCGDRYTLPPDAVRPGMCRRFTPLDQGAPRRAASFEEIQAECHSTARPSISTTDASDYAWLTWGKDHLPYVSRLEVA